MSFLQKLLTPLNKKFYDKNYFSDTEATEACVRLLHVM